MTVRIQCRPHVLPYWTSKRFCFLQIENLHNMGTNSDNFWTYHVMYSVPTTCSLRYGSLKFCRIIQRVCSVEFYSMLSFRVLLFIFEFVFLCFYLFPFLAFTFVHLMPYWFFHFFLRFLFFSFLGRQRGPTYVWTFNLKTKEKAGKWTLAGVCLLLQI